MAVKDNLTKPGADEPVLVRLPVPGKERNYEPRVSGTKDFFESFPVLKDSEKLPLSMIRFHQCRGTSAIRIPDSLLTRRPVSIPPVRRSPATVICILPPRGICTHFQLPAN